MQQGGIPLDALAALEDQNRMQREQMDMQVRMAALNFAVQVANAANADSTAEAIAAIAVRFHTFLNTGK